MKASSIREITNILAEMFEQKPPLVKQFTMKGVEYGFIPKLEDMSFGEYVDLDTYIGDSSTDRISAAERLQSVTEATVWVQEFLQNNHQNLKIVRNN